MIIEDLIISSATTERTSKTEFVCESYEFMMFGARNPKTVRYHDVASSDKSSDTSRSPPDATCDDACSDDQAHDVEKGSHDVARAKFSL